MENHMKKIVLLNALFNEFMLAEPMSICALSSYLKRDGHEVTLIDPSIQGMNIEEIIDCIFNLSPDIFGISIHRDTNKMDALYIAKELRNKGYKGFICAGGHGPSIGILNEGKYNTMYTSPSYLELGCYIDVFIIGEGELTLSEIASIEKYEKHELKMIKGIAYIENDAFVVTNAREKISDLDTLPYIDRSMLRVLKDKFPIDASASITSGRGCPYDCSFCSVKSYERSQCLPYYRLRSIDNILDEIKQINQLYGIKNFNFEDDSICAGDRKSIDRLIEFAERIICEKMNITFSMYMRIDLINKKLIELLSCAGLNNIFVGVENIDQNILDFLDKNLLVDTIMEKNDELLNAGFSHELGSEKRIMVGYINFLPMSNYETLMKSYNFVRENKITPKALRRKLRLYTGTTMVDKIIRLGYYDDNNLQGWRYEDSFIFSLRLKINSFFNFIFDIRDKIRTIEKFNKAQKLDIKHGINIDNIITYRKKLDEFCFDFYLNSVEIINKSGDRELLLTRYYNDSKDRVLYNQDVQDIIKITNDYYKKYSIDSIDLFRR